MSIDSRNHTLAAICNGTVIDHIKVGEGLHLLKLLHLDQNPEQVTIGINLPSDSMGKKDLIKIEDRELVEAEVNQVAVFAPLSTISIVQNFEVVKKFQVTLPTDIYGLMKCPNQRCITNHEPVTSHFVVKQKKLCCHYCSKIIPLEAAPSCSQ